MLKNINKFLISVLELKIRSGKIEEKEEAELKIGEEKLFRIKLSVARQI